MNWLKTIGSFLTGGSSDGANNVMKVASGIGNWIDKGKFTDQEKAEHSAALIPHFQKFMDSTVNENSKRSQTRRDIAIWIIRTEIALLVFSVGLYKIDLEWSKYVYQICTDSPLGLLTLGVGAFFFGTHLVRASKGN